MKSRAATFLLGAVAASLVWGVVLYLPRVISLQGARVAEWSEEEVKKRGLADFRSGTAILQRWDISTVADACMADFRRMALGGASLGPVYEVTGGKHIVLVFSADRDQWGRSVTDRVIAYVYDAERQELIGKFWLPMA